MTDAPPPAPAAPAPVPAASDGKTLGIVALVVTFFISLLGIILGFVARSQSKKAGVKNTPATVAIVLGFIFFIGSLIATFVVIGSLTAVLAQCADLGPGVHEVGGWTVTCG